MSSALTLALSGVSIVLAAATAFFWWRSKAAKIDPETIRQWQHTDQPSTIDSSSPDDPRLQEVAEIVDAPPDEVPDRVRKLDAKVRSLQDDIGNVRERWAESWLDQQTKTAGTEIPQTLVATLEGGEFDDAEALAKSASERENVIVLAVAPSESSFSVGVGQGLTSAVKASDIADEISATAGGGSGGDEAVATGGGADLEDLQAAIDKKRTELENSLSN